LFRKEKKEERETASPNPKSSLPKPLFIFAVKEKE